VSESDVFEPAQVFRPTTAGDMPQGPLQAERFSFTGNGGEYFRIWIVNLLLTIVTLGIYSAWAKVRRTRYFYASTQVAGSSFEYHGNPIAILKGRFVALALLAAYNLAFQASLIVGIAAVAALVVIMPWLIWKSTQFKLYNSSYRGIRFGFKGSIGQVYKVFLLLPILAAFTLYLLAPLAHQRFKKFQHEESRFGSTNFSFHATVGSFYKSYLICFLVALAGGVVLGIFFGGTMVAVFANGGLKQAAPGAIGSLMLFIFSLYLWVFMLVPIFLTMIQNLIWNNTKLGAHRFKCEMKWNKTAFIMITNIIAIMLTFGLFLPFAHIRSMRYRIESMSWIPHDSLENFIADTQANASSTGEGMADLLDFDLSL
jgi:uncharacterized membrane protein YjgN (DUF898 family)